MTCNAHEFHASARFGLGELLKSLPCPFLENELESSFATRYLLTKLKDEYHFCRLTEGDEEYAIISVECVWSSFEDATHFDNSRWWDCLAKCITALVTHGPTQCRVRYSFSCSGEIVTITLHNARVQNLAKKTSCLVDPNFGSWWLPPLNGSHAWVEFKLDSRKLICSVYSLDEGVFCRSKFHLRYSSSLC